MTVGIDVRACNWDHDRNGSLVEVEQPELLDT